jgi:hypothetical protein
VGTFHTNCPDSTDVNDDGKVDISDPIYLMSYLFLGGRPPDLPFPLAGMDPTADPLDCEP